MKRLLPLLFTACLVFAAGCFVYVPTSSDEGIELNFEANFSTQENQFVIEGEFLTTGIDPEKDTIEDVYVCLYDEDQSLIEYEYAGDIDASWANTSVTIITDEQPAYIVPESADLWGDAFRTRGYRLENGEYQKYTIESAPERFGNENAPNGGYTFCGDY